MPHQFHLRNIQEHSSHRADAKQSFQSSLEKKRVFDGLDFYTFPTVEKLAFASESGLRECGLGYRAKYVQATAKKIYEEKIDLENLKNLPYLRSKKNTCGVSRRRLESG